MSASSRASRRTVTVLFCDVVDSTPLGERLDAETYRRVQTGYFDAVRTVLERHGGTVEKFIGDAVMAVFGLPTLHEDDGLRALRAASELRAAVAPLDEELARDHGLRLRLRVGVATGEVVVEGQVGDQAFATGETVVVAERLERAAQPSELLVDNATYRLAAGAAIVEPVDPVPAKGKTDRVAAWRLIGVEKGTPALPRRHDTPLVGRRAELAQLRKAYDEAVSERRCRLVTVLGPAGIGKSRLTVELLRGLREEATVLVGHCLPYGDGITFWPVSEIFPNESFKGTTDEIFRRVRTRVERLARERPLVICFEDIHWGEPTFLGLLEYLTGWLADSPVLLMCLARADLLERESLLGGETVPLAPLPGGDAGALLDVLGTPAEARARIEEAAEGNPFFAEQMTAMALEEGPGFVVPASIRALLAARLDRLEPDERAAIERAAVIGREFPLGAVAALSDGDVARPLLSLVRRELLEPDRASFEDGFRFRHTLIREAAYDATPKALRAELHERHGRRIAGRGAPDIVVGYHLEQAFLTRAELGPTDDDGTLAREAGELLAAAGRRAHDRDDLPAAENLLGRAARLLDGEGRSYGRVMWRLAETHWSLGRADEAEAHLDAALASAERSGDALLEWHARLDRAAWESMRGPRGVRRELELARGALDVFREAGDDFGLAQAWRQLAWIEFKAGRYGAAEAASEQALSHARKVGFEREISRGGDVLCSCLLFGPSRTDAATLRAEEMLADSGANRLLQANVLVALVGLEAMAARFGRARAYAARAEQIYAELGVRVAAAGLMQVAGSAEMLAGDTLAAETAFRRAYEVLEPVGAAGIVAAELADVLFAQGRYEEAAEYAAIQVADDVPAEVTRRAVEARLAAVRGDIPEALELAEAAVALAGETDSPNLLGNARAALADVYLASGDAGSAAAELTRAVEAYQRKGNLPAVDRLSALLDQPSLR